MIPAVRPDRIRTHPIAKSGPPQEPDYVVLIYYGINPSDPSTNKEPVQASHRMLEQLKQLAPKTRAGNVSFFVQGYEKSSANRWRTARYLISNGTVSKQEVPENASLFEPGTFKDFLVSAPPAKKTVLVFGAHGKGFPGFGGEKIENGKMDGSKFDEMSLHDFEQCISDSGRKLHVLDLDACFGGQWEVVSTLHRLAPNIVASPEATYYYPTSSDPSPQVLLPAFEKIAGDPSISPKKFSKFLIKNIKENQTDFGLLPDSYTPTLAHYSSKKIEQLSPILDRLGRALAGGLDDPEIRPLILKASDEAFHYETGDYKDLKDFAKRLKRSGVLEKCGYPRARKEIKAALKAASPEMFKGAGYEEAGPLSVFVPSGPDSDEIEKMLSSQRHKADAGGSLLRSFERQSKEFAQTYDSLPEVPEGWKKFVQKLLHLVVTETLPAKIRQAESRMVL